VQVGRVALIVNGIYSEKLVAIINILDEKRVLVEGPGGLFCFFYLKYFLDYLIGVRRHVTRLSSLQLTDFNIKIGHDSKSKAVKKAFERARVFDKWKQTSWAKKLFRRKVRANLSDFDRFKVRVLRRKLADSLKHKEPLKK
jgi:large subunit ribosomal protein L14e